MAFEPNPCKDVVDVVVGEMIAFEERRRKPSFSVRVVVYVKDYLNIF